MRSIKIGIDDAERLWQMQVKAFQDLYEKYQDTETSPATEKIDDNFRFMEWSMGTPF